MIKKILVYFLILLLVADPASAGEVSLTRWVLNVTLDESGIVEEVIQVEIQNAGSLPLDGISFIVPSSTVTMIYDFSHTFSSYGQTGQQQAVSGGTRVDLSFNQSVKPGDKWSGRIGYTAENMAVKVGSDYSLDLLVDAPQAIVSGKNVVLSITPDADIRAQVFLPRSYELTSVQPDPFRKLFQYGRMVPTWTPEKLHIGDTIRIKSSYSDVLAKIVNNDDRARKLKADIKDAKDAGKIVQDAETYLANGNENNNKAFASFGGKDYSVALQYAGYSKDELTKAENSLIGSTAKATPKATEKTPGFEAYIFGFALLLLRNV